MGPEEMKWVMVGIWSFLMILAVVVEAATVALVSIWFAGAAVVSLILAFFNVPVSIQCIVYVVVLVGLFIATRPLAKKINSKKVAIEGTAEGLIGEKVTVTSQVTKEIIGEVKARYDRYSAICADDNIYEVGEKAIIIGVNGNKVIIRKE